MIKYSQILNKDIEGQKTTAIMAGGVDDPQALPRVSFVPKAGSTLPSGTYFISYAWVNQYGNTLPSPPASVTVAASQELTIDTPTFPKGVTKAFVYIGTSTTNGMKQGEIVTSNYKHSAALAIGEPLPSFNNSYEWVTPVAIRGSIPEGGNIIGAVKLTDGMDALAINTNGSVNIVPMSSDGTELFSQNNPGSVQMKKRSAKEPFTGTANMTHNFKSSMTGFVISNDGDKDLTFTIGTGVYTVKAGEVFDEYFDPFYTVTISTTVPFRAYGRG